ncbi:MAG: hypothetical protein RJA70_214 [Pseudomonadota bacterium]|jgi:uncharacterized membrane protein YadS
MQHHLGTVVTIGVILLAIGLVVAIALESMAVTYAVGVSALVMAFVLGIARIRPEGQPPEHHMKSDQSLDDTRP